MSLAVPPDTQWYHCHCRLGAVRVGVVVGTEVFASLSGPLAVIRRAALLGEVELVLQAIELWQQLDLDLIPENATVPGTSHSENQTLEIVFRHASMPEYYPVRLQIPTSAVTLLKPNDAALAGALEIVWPEIESQIVLDRVQLPEQESQLLEHGAMMLLPSSFESPWQVSLVMPLLDNQEMSGEVTLQPEQITFSTDADARTQAGQPDQAEFVVRLKQERPIGLDTLLGAAAGSSVPFNLKQSLAAAELLRAEQIIGAGSVAPIAGGFAIYIDHIATAGTSPEY